MSTRYVWNRYNVEYEYNSNRQAFQKDTYFLNDDTASRTVYLENSGYYSIFTKAEPALAQSGSLDGDAAMKLSGRLSSDSFQAGDTITFTGNQYYIFSEDEITEDVVYAKRAYTSMGITFSCTVTESDSGRYLLLDYSDYNRLFFYSVYRTSIKGSTSYGPVSGTSQSSYPSDGVQGSYWYTYQGSDNIDPTAVGYNKTTPKGGESITINVTPKSNTYGGTITYKYEVQLSGGTWTNIGSTTSTAKSYVIPKGTTTFRARVVASDNMGFTSTDYVTGNTVSVINNTAPSISGEDSDLGTFRYEYPTISYIITDPDEQTVTRKIELDSVIVATEEAIILDQEYTYTVTEEQMSTLADGVHTIKITATDSEGASAVRQYTFTKFFGSDTLYQRLRRLNDLGLYDTIYFENMASNIIRPNGMTVQETIDKIEADLAELEK